MLTSSDKFCAKNELSINAFSSTKKIRVIFFMILNLLKKIKNRFKNTYKFSDGDLKNLFCCFEKVDILVKIWTPGKNFEKLFCGKH